VDQGNILYPRELPKYAAEIFLTTANDPFSAFFSSARFTSVQTQITPKMRETAVKWMIQVHSRLAMTSDSLYNAVTFFDIACCRRAIARNHLQLLILTCLWVSTKVEEGREMTQEVLDLSADPFTREEIIECERDLIQVLEFRTNFPTRKFFLRCILDAIDSDSRISEAANFACEGSLLAIEVCDFPLPVIAAAAASTAFIGLRLPCPIAKITKSASLQTEVGLERCALALIAKLKDILAGTTHILSERYAEVTADLHFDDITFPRINVS
jgi:hypothetical protein